MLRVKNFEPQWGYVPAANRFGRTVSIILVATAIGAISGGGVVLSLVDLPTGQASARPHTLAAPVQAIIEAAQPNPSMDSGANGRLRAAPADIAPLAGVALNQASAHTLAAPVEALIGAPEAAQPNPQPVVESSMDSGSNGRLGAEATTNPKIAAPADTAPLAEVALNEASVKVATPPSAAAAPAENKTTKNRRGAHHAGPRVARGGYGAWGWGGTASHLY
jgi:hypothetical protein